MVAPQSEHTMLLVPQRRWAARPRIAATASGTVASSASAGQIAGSGPQRLLKESHYQSVSAARSAGMSWLSSVGVNGAPA